MAQLLLSPVGILVQQLANSGQPLSGGQIFIYVAGTTTPQTTYTDSTGMTANANPIVLNSAGRLPNVSVWVNSNTPHKMVLQDANGVTLSTIDQLYGINDPFLINQVSSVLPTAGGTANALTVANPTPITSQGLGTEQWFVPGLANTGPAAVVIDGLPSLSIFYLSKALTGGELQPGVPVLIKNDGTRYNLAWSAKGPTQDYYVDTGSVNALAVTVNMAQLSQGSALGTKIRVKAAFTTTAFAPTINVNGQVFNIVTTDGVSSPAIGSIVAGLIYEFIAFGVTVAYALQNPSRVTGSFTLTLTGVSSGGTGTVTYGIYPDGKAVDATVPASLQGVSNTTAMTGTGQPAAIVPATAKRLSLALQDNSAAVAGNLVIGATAVWTMGNSVANTVMTSGNNKGFLAAATQMHWDLS